MELELEAGNGKWYSYLGKQLGNITTVEHAPQLVRNALKLRYNEVHGSTVFCFFFWKNQKAGIAEGPQEHVHEN